MEMEQRIAGIQAKNAVQDERLDKHDELLDALGARVRWLERLFWMALGGLGVLSSGLIPLFLK